MWSPLKVRIIHAAVPGDHAYCLAAFFLLPSYARPPLLYSELLLLAEGTAQNCQLFLDT